MIRITGNKLIIEINCEGKSESPLEKLSHMQKGLIGIIAIIDHKDAPKAEVQDALFYLRDLLKETLIDERQASALNNHIGRTPELQREF